MSNVFQTCLKGFKLKRLVVEPKTAQLVKPNEESVDPPNSTGRPPAQSIEGAKNLVFSKMISKVAITKTNQAKEKS